MLDSAQVKDDQRRRAAAVAIGEVAGGVKLGLGTGRTAEHFVRLLGERVAAGLDVLAVPTSERTARLAGELGIRLATLDDEPALDLMVDGADEVDPKLRLIKGGGGALLREKIVATAAARMVIICEEAKRVAVLGAFPLPIEVVPFGLAVTRRALDAALAGLGLAGDLTLRQAGGETYLTDGGHYILDAALGAIPDPEGLARALVAIPGVVEHGLFIGLASAVIVGHSDRAERLGE